VAKHLPPVVARYITQTGPPLIAGFVFALTQLRVTSVGVFSGLLFTEEILSCDAIIDGLTLDR
jgi:hypothetical protein